MIFDFRFFFMNQFPPGTSVFSSGLFEFYEISRRYSKVKVNHIRSFYLMFPLRRRKADIAGVVDTGDKHKVANRDPPNQWDTQGPEGN